MLKPSVADLLRGTADALADVVAAVPAGPARDQVQASVALLRKAARALPGLTPYLLADIADLAAFLGTGADQPAELLGRAAALPAELADLDQLSELDLELRDELAKRAVAADDPALVALLGRLNAREAALRLSPWER